MLFCASEGRDLLILLNAFHGVPFSKAPRAIEGCEAHRQQRDPCSSEEHCPGHLQADSNSTYGTLAQAAEGPRAAASPLSVRRHACDRPLCFASQDATRLKSENDALRKLSEDAVLDQQLKKALQETDKLKAAADAYKKDLLQQKLSDKEWELQQAREQMADVEKENSGQAPCVLQV